METIDSTNSNDNTCVSPESGPPDSENASAGLPIRMRALMIGFALAMFICAITPFNNVYPVRLRRGPNHLLLKLLKRGDDLKFTLGLRARTNRWRPSHNCEDWLVDLTDLVPDP